MTKILVATYKKTRGKKNKIGVHPPSKINCYYCDMSDNRIENPLACDYYLVTLVSSKGREHSYNFADKNKANEFTKRIIDQATYYRNK